MSLPIAIPVGSETWHLNIPAARRVELRPPDGVPSTATAGEQVREALEKPFEFEPLRRALTPDDRVVVVVDEALPAVAEMVTAILRHLGTASIAPAAVTLLTLPDSRNAGWIDALPDEFADVRTEVHDPADRKKLAYLATTKGERRIYLNRTLVEADFAIVLSGRRYDPNFGYVGAESLIFPAFSDEESRTAGRGRFQVNPPKADADAVEVGRLLGTPFFVQVIEDSERVLGVVAGLLNSTAEGIRRQDTFWQVRTADRPDTIVVSVPAEGASFGDVAMAALHGSHAVPREGNVVVLAPPMDWASEGLSVLRHCDDPREAIKELAAVQPEDWAASHLWATVASRCRLFVANLDDGSAEELFATRIGNERELQRLVETSERVLILPNGHRTRVELS